MAFGTTVTSRRSSDVTVEAGASDAAAEYMFFCRRLAADIYFMFKIMSRFLFGVSTRSTRVVLVMYASNLLNLCIFVVMRMPWLN